MMSGKLKCPKCGSERFWLITSLEIRDELWFDDDGEARIDMMETHDLFVGLANPVADFERVECQECGEELKAEEVRETLREMEERKKLKSPALDRGEEFIQKKQGDN
jgi:transcription initiation factor IIE alpha subunit